MRNHRLTAGTLIIMLALAAATAAAQPADNVLARIPADSVGFVGAANVSTAFANMSRFIYDVSMGSTPPNLLELAQISMQIGEGFNENGGWAVVLLNPAPFGVDYAAVVRGEQYMDDGPPMAILLPGSPSMFSAYESHEENGYTVVHLGGDPGYVKTLGAYTVLAPKPEYVDAIVNAPATLAQAAGRDHLAMLARGDFFLYADTQRLAPMVKAGIDQASAMIGQIPLPDESVRPVLEVYAGLIRFYGGFVPQVQAVSAAVTFAEDGVLADSLVTMMPNTPLATILQGTRTGKDPLFGSLPPSKYVVALGAAWEPLRGEALKAYDKILEDLMRTMFAAGDNETVAKSVRIARDLQARTRGSQYYYGAPDGQGVLAFTFAMAVDDAKAVMALMPEHVEAQMALTRTMVGQLPEMQSVLQTQYVKGAETVAGVSVDALDFEGMFALMGPEEQQQVRTMLQQIYGQDRIRVYIAPASSDKVVVTFGGGTGFLARAIDAARGGASLQQDANIGRALARLPLKPMTACVFSLANTLDVVRTAMQTFAGPEADAMLQGVVVQSATPLAYGAATEGAGMRQAVFIPKDAVSDIYRNVQVIIARQMQGQQQWNSGDDGDF
ncbi:MAG: hypothetical protein GX591_16705 [Planctomycetes bacterium]|nr:hypothetical protein [Planctomycetota bacterium]